MSSIEDDDTDIDLEVAAGADQFTRRLRFYGAGDYATYWQVERAADVVRDFDPSRAPDDVNGIVELHNARLFVEGGFMPPDTTEEQRAILAASAKSIRRTVAEWFNALPGANLSERLAEVGWQYHEHLLDLLAVLGVFARYEPDEMMPALDAAGIHLGDMLTSKRLVEAYDKVLRDRLLANPTHAELLIRHHFDGETKKPTFLPASLTSADSRTVLEGYIDSDPANPNYLKLIANAPVNGEKETGVDAKLVVRARRRYDTLVAELFERSPGIKTGCTVSVSATQLEPVKAELNDLVVEYSFSQIWLDDTLDFASVLNNFQFLFEFAPQFGLLTMPAFESERRGLADMMGMRGSKDYQTGHVFHVKDQSTLLQTVMYQRYLASKDIDLEEVIRWYFEEHLPAEYGIAGFVFNPSSPMANYLERCRNLFAEMESIATQLGLLVQDGEIDHEVAAAGADFVRYRTIPSALEGKYAYASEHSEIRTILHLLFSDQSHLTYINEDLCDENAVDLLQRNRVPYEALHEYQRPLADKLIEAGIAENTGDRIRLKDPALFRVLKSLSESEAVAYHHLSAESREHLDKMVSDGWLVRRSSLLTNAEGAYFNYNLNSVDFSNGPKLRNKYQHGRQPMGVGEAEYQETYFRALRLMVALTIKINDEFWLLDKAKAEGSTEDGASHESQ